MAEDGRWPEASSERRRAEILLSDDDTTEEALYPARVAVEQFDLYAWTEPHCVFDTIRACCALSESNRRAGRAEARRALGERGPPVLPPNGRCSCDEP